MKTQIRTLDEIATNVRGYKISTPKQKYFVTYMQKMQSLYGSRKFLLKTAPIAENTLSVSLREWKNNRWETIGSRTAVFNDEKSIYKAIKSLEKKAKCKLYYVLLISTDGEYL